MAFNFDLPIARADTHSVKYDGRKSYFGTEEVLPMWVADMDFAVPECVSQALLERAAHPVFGYTFYPESLYQSVMQWLERRHGWSIERDWIVMVPGVVPSLYACCLAYAGEGEGVIVQPPVYFPFFSAVKDTGRHVLLNPLQRVKGRYEINFSELEALAPKAKLLMLCSPHNPVGRVWTRTELLELLRIAKKNNLMILSDDIHADLVYPGITHTFLGALDEGYQDFLHTHLITAVAPSKTFNIPGLGLSTLIVPDAERRAAVQKIFAGLHVSNTNPFSILAYEAAYRSGEAWLDALLDYLKKNRDLVRDFLPDHAPQIELIEPEGTYLLWLDCRSLGMGDADLRDFFVKRCRIGMNPGSVFGEGGSGYMRMNIGTPAANVKRALTAIKSALNSR